MRRCFLKFDKLIVDDNAYIYNDMEGRVEKLPHKVMIIRIILLIAMISLINWQKWALVSHLINPPNNKLHFFIPPGLLGFWPVVVDQPSLSDQFPVHYLTTSGH